MKLLDANAYQPNSINDIIFGSDEGKTRIDEIVEGRKPFPSNGKNGILLYGVWGSGKTTLAKMLPTAIESIKTNKELCDFEFIQCKQGMNGAELMKRIENQSMLISFNYSGYHYFILDEVDNLTEAAQASLKAAMNTTQSIFILTTNHIDKIERGVINRSIRVDMCGASAKKWLPYIKNILSENEIEGVADADLLKLIDSCNGSARDIMDSISTIYARKIKELIEESVELSF
ncbi:AAA family ATPase [Polynucleobacter paneuropaeus]|jgi:DNA polymerase III gamma/tau subunit|uniref:AAA family ATPase n=1 Tax=Polynucleobacter paneuropaeus TaxID=2527775 RepID=UPI001BFDCA70|nr:AAA family ATPase [Polynucleobacter paneuropaeus]MBT8515569.1 AAA family ATPase [Polynucleobacter paneuropaeus]MBT8553809.1 AAA family ATPase [Polynucleobacter paneuropaeus]QWD52473.1 AAA family ATPase [Polynucleobacter paneuropaeus]